MTKEEILRLNRLYKQSVLRILKEMHYYDKYKRRDIRHRLPTTIPAYLFFKKDETKLWNDCTHEFVYYIISQLTSVDKEEFVKAYYACRIGAFFERYRINYRQVLNTYSTKKASFIF